MFTLFTLALGVAIGYAIGHPDVSVADMYNGIVRRLRGHR